MSQGQVAIAELQRRVGRMNPVAGFRIIDSMLELRDQAIDMFEQIACGMAFDQGRIAECFVRNELLAIELLIGIDSPMLNIAAEPAAAPPATGLLAPDGSLIQ